MNRNEGIGIVVVAVAVLLLVASCTSRKKLVKPATHADYQWMSAKFNGNVETANGDMSFSGVIRMRRDSVIWLSASAFLGMESIRTLITQDSMVLINRLDQTYLNEPFSTVAEKLHLPSTIQESQSLLSGDGTSDHVEIHFGPYLVKIQYSDILWDEPTTFPIKINKNYERVKL